MNTSKSSSTFSYFACVFLFYTIVIYTDSAMGDLWFAEWNNYQSTANISSSWYNHHSPDVWFETEEGGSFTVILANQGAVCGFICPEEDCNQYIFGIFIVAVTRDGAAYDYSPQIIWSANRSNRVGIHARLQLTEEGDLLLSDSEGVVVWSTNTAWEKVVNLNLTNEGNLVLFGENSSIIWQSFDSPTDTLVLGQKLTTDKSLTSSEGMYTLSLTGQGLFASIRSNPRQIYYRHSFSQEDDIVKSYIMLSNGCVLAEPGSSRIFSIPNLLSVQYMKLDSDGHLRVYEWINYYWKVVADLLDQNDGCNYPMVCGNFGICSNGTCRVQNSRYFRPVNDSRPELGFNETVPISCNSSHFHTFEELDSVTVFSLNIFEDDYHNLTFGSKDLGSCKDACLRNCSCKAVTYQDLSSESGGNCYMQFEIFSFMTNIQALDSVYNSTTFVKVQRLPNTLGPASPPTLGPTSPLPVGKTTKVRRIPVGLISGILLGAVFVLSFIVGFVCFVQKRYKSDEEAEYLDQVPGLPTRFSYEEVKIATNNFNTKLGEGGFGVVYKGTFEDGTQIAVKCLEGLSHVKKSFVAEVETIGSIHHFNLVRLIGFCAEKMHGWMLVYEYVSNGSLDRWIFERNNENSNLDWQCKKKVILDIAKGLSYLHEECRQKIIHLDIKPQNILLDENFNAKLADFGLSKLVNKNQSQIVTTMRGTPGYLAPEWLNSVITEKVDVYSFGVIVLEMCCGRKNIDRSQPEEEMHLIRIFQDKMGNGNLSDMVNSQCKDMLPNRVEVVEMMKLAAWCLQNDFTKRPSMSIVVKVLEGVPVAEENLDFRFLNPLQIHKIVNPCNTQLSPSVLSKPR